MRAGALSPLSRENTRAVGWKSFIHTAAPAGEEAGDQGPSEVGANAWSKRSLCPSPARMRPARYLNIGYHKVECSLSEIVQLILWHRPDVLFLGDLGVVHNKIGRLKQRMESSLGDEWFMLTNISPYNKRGGPVGMGVVVHCSLAKHVRTLDLPCPEGGDTATWSQAVTGRIFPLQLSREGCPHTWQLAGVYQHVAAESNAQSRAHVLATMGAFITRAEC